MEALTIQRLENIGRSAAYETFEQEGLGPEPDR